ncbi:hypothetical protein AWB76_05250 [Caballeronia temeraria]|uniref:Uncharacterized protein n=1 Tax=Caballeronia temeraria TaxID=1777137 RepID=A0A158C8U8_9BURK|nr:hypothetical protein [Caballeronia temeraria]SAK78764.1 hypothetical protein AWB76_05250 [Caballeronia temeraria]
MKVIIVWHEPPPLGSAEELHRFRFEADDGFGPPRIHEITLRTARVIVGNLRRDDAVTKMLRSILSTQRADYDTLIRSTYTDDNDANVAPRAAARRWIGEQNRVPRVDH